MNLLKKYEKKLQTNNEYSHLPDSSFLNIIFASSSTNPYKDSEVRITNEPLVRNSKFIKLSSPIFRIKGDDVNSLENKLIFFCYCDNPLEFVQYLKSKSENDVTSYFSIGLSSVIIITNESFLIESFLNEHFSKVKESWKIRQNKIEEYELHNVKEKIQSTISYQAIPDLIPEDIKFLIREYHAISNDILETSEQYSPYAHEKILKLINHFTNEVLEDLYYILDDDKIYENSPLYNEHLKIGLDKDEQIVLKNELKSDTISLLVQINSSLVYVKNQYFSGIPPILKNSSQISEFKLLGVGCAARSLFVMLDKLEIFLTSTRLETLDKPSLLAIKFNGKNTLSFSSSTKHDPSFWREDKNFESYQIEIGNLEERDTAFSRIGYYSARLGFKEYRYFATSALQVLISAASNEWSLVNYTHEIIHGHVKYMIQHILQDVDLAKIHSEWMFLNQSLYELGKASYNVKEIGQIAIANYLDSSNRLGSLSRSTSSGSGDDISKEYESYSAAEFDSHLNSQYWEINEIFVHSLDFFYIYKSNYNIYIRSIWLSWITQPVVKKDSSQYILRSLLVISLTISGSPFDRMKKAIFELNKVFEELKTRSSIFNQIILDLKELETNNTFYFRFCNCLCLSDYSFQFLTFPNTDGIKNGDKQVFDELGDFNDDSAPFIYDTDISDWPFQDIESKFYYILENTHKSILNYNKVKNMQFLSSRLLLIISSV